MLYYLGVCNVLFLKLADGLLNLVKILTGQKRNLTENLHCPALILTSAGGKHNFANISRGGLEKGGDLLLMGYNLFDMQDISFFDLFSLCYSFLKL